MYENTSATEQATATLNPVEPATAPAPVKPNPLTPNKFSRAFARRQWRASFSDRNAWRQHRQRGEDFSFRAFVAAQA